MSNANQKAYLETEKSERINCLFNPDQLTLSQSNTWDADKVPGKDTPELFFSGGQSGSLSMELMFDTTSESGVAVTKYTNKLLKLMDVDPSLPSHDTSTNRGRPPWVTFHWGRWHSWKAIVASLSLKFTFFASDGTPLRANVSITLTQYEADANWGPQNPTSGTPDPQRTHSVRQGETLDRIAALHYGDATLWRKLAEANGIRNPLALRPGTRLNIPHKVDVA